jgi:hypothetical protein
MKSYNLMISVEIISLLVSAASSAYATSSDSLNLTNGERTEINNSGKFVNTAGGVRPILSDIIGHWAESIIKDLIGKGIINGDNDNHFKPDSNISREELAVMVAKLFKLNNKFQDQDFKDVPQNRWSYDLVEATKDYFTTATNPNGSQEFGPLLEVRREDAAAIIIKALIQQNPKIQLLDASSTDDLLSTHFLDFENISNPLRSYVATAIQNNVLEGEEMSLFLPQKNLTRAEAATMLDRLVNNGLIVDNSTEDHSIMLREMQDLARNGKVFGIDFMVGHTLLDEIHQKLGQPDSKNTNGEYSENYSLGMGQGTFSFVVGKGEIINEIRSYGSLEGPFGNISDLSLSDINKVLGSTDKTIQINDQQILIYHVGEFELKFCFTSPGEANSESYLKYFGVYKSSEK